MGSNISQGPGKCLKHRRAKSEEQLAAGKARRFAKNSMGRLLSSWNAAIVNGGGTVTTVNILNGKQYCEDQAAAPEAKITNKEEYRVKKSHSMYDECAKPVQHGYAQQATLEKILSEITQDSIYEVQLNKGLRGLGFSIMEENGLILVKQLFPSETASQCGLMQEGDVLLQANGYSLTGLSSFEALQVLRTAENPVQLTLCRIQNKSFRVNHLPSSQNDGVENDNKPGDNSEDGINMNKAKEFEVTITKVGGSLGFTLRKEGSGGCCHLVRALVKEPAISDGRIQPGDRIISVNGTDIGSKSHEEAVKFLRDCENEVTLKLRRSASSWSVTSFGSSQSESNTKTLRREALEMLNDLALKKSERIGSRHSDHDNNNELRHNSSETSEGSFCSKKVPMMPCSRDQNQFQQLGDLGDEPVSLPALDIKNQETFHHNDPVYHSINVLNFKTKVEENEDVYLPNGNENLSNTAPAQNNMGLLKWKGVVLDSENETKSQSPDTCNYEIIAVELQRSWNSRFGFSLCQHGEKTIISKIHEDSIASKDGRLRVNDEILKINEKDIDGMSTSAVIEMLRNVRGLVTIAVRRKT